MNTKRGEMPTIEAVREMARLLSQGSQEFCGAPFSRWDAEPCFALAEKLEALALALKLLGQQKKDAAEVTR